MTMSKKAIRVLCVFSTLDRGGAESMCMNIYRHINRNKVQFDFLKHTLNEGSFEKEILSLGGRIYIAPQFNGLNVIAYSNWWHTFLEQHPEYQIIHGHYFTISTVYFRIAKKMGRITIGHIHASAVNRKSSEWLVHQIGRYVDKALACSETAGRWAYGRRPYTVLKNAIDIDSFCFNQSIREEYRKSLGIYNDEFVLGTVANLSIVKNPMGLIDIFIQLRKRNPKSKLLWVGEGDQRNRIEERILAEHLQTSIILIGARNDVSKLLQAMDAFAFPSFNEGLGMAAIEAQAAGLQTYCSNTIPNEVGISSLCHFLPLESPEIWAEKIFSTAYTYERINMKEQIQKAGYDIFETSSWLESMYEELYTNLCNK